jgi:hypothetical protein
MEDKIHDPSNSSILGVWKAEDERERRKDVVAMAKRGERVRPDFSDVNRVNAEELYGPRPTINRKLPLPNAIPPKITQIDIDSRPDLSSAADK